MAGQQDYNDPDIYGGMADDDPADPSSGGLDEDELADAMVSGGAPQGSGGALSQAQQAKYAGLSAQLRKEAGEETQGALTAAQKRANASRDALRRARERLLADKPNRAGMWFAVAKALGTPSETGGDIGESISNAAGAVEPYANAEEQYRRQRLSSVDALDQQLAGYGDDADAVDPTLIAAQLAQAKQRLSDATRLDVARIRASRAGSASQSSFAKLLADAGILPGTPEYDRQMRAHIAKEQHMAADPNTPYNLTDADIKTLEKVRSNDIDLNTALGRGGSNEKRQAMIAWLTDNAPDWGVTDKKMMQQTIQQYNSSKVTDPGGQLIAFGAVVSHLDLVKQLAMALKNRSPSRTVDLIKNRIKDEFGMSGPVDLKSAIQFLSPEVNKAFLGAPGGQDERQAFQQLFDGSRKPDVVAHQADAVLLPMLGAKMNGLISSFYQGIPKVNQDKYRGFPERKLPKHAREVLRDLGVEGNWDIDSEGTPVRPSSPGAPAPRIRVSDQVKADADSYVQQALGAPHG